MIDARTPFLPLPDGNCLSDADLWGLLAQLFESHPDWPDARCRAILQAWVKIRSGALWQSRLIRFWRRWKEHQSDLKNGLSQAGPLTWAQRCRFCEFWSANRPVMAPFCAVAEILLDDGGPQTHGVKIAPHTDTHRRPGAQQTTAPTSEIVVVSTTGDAETFARFGSSRQLLWALDNSGLSWGLYQPWKIDKNLNPEIVKGVIFWSHWHRSNDFVFHAIAVEKACQSRQIPVINSLLSGWDVRHSTVLRNLKQLGIRCPRFQKFTNIDDITLPYPLIFRVDGMHRGRQMHLVRDAEEARELLITQRGKFLACRGTDIAPPPNLAVEFIDVADEQGRYHKYRAFVVGENVLRRHKFINDHWLVNFSSPELKQESARATRAYILDEKPDLELLVRAGRASGSDVTALDYSRDRNGDYVFWEANRLFKMNGDKGYDLPATGADPKATKRAARDRKLGEALLMLLQKRFIRPLIQATHM